MFSQSHLVALPTGQAISNYVCMYASGKKLLKIFNLFFLSFPFSFFFILTEKTSFFPSALLLQV
jgi:hypothetical protein